MHVNFGRSFAIFDVNQQTEEGDNRMRNQGINSNTQRLKYRERKTQVNKSCEPMFSHPLHARQNRLL